MKPKTIQTQIDSDGMLRLEVPCSVEDAGQPVKVIVKPAINRKRPWSPNFFAEVVGQWEGEFPQLKGRWSKTGLRPSLDSDRNLN